MSQAPRSTPLVATALERSSDLAILLGVSWLARVLFVIAIGDAHSVDVDSWQRALEAEHDGQNPYETGVLNWPPFWLQIIALLDAVASHVDTSFWTALRIYLIMAESAIVVTLYLTLVSVGARRDAVRRALLVGIALNPVAILLVCQHGNSDVNVGLLVDARRRRAHRARAIARRRLLAVRLPSARTLACWRRRYRSFSHRCSLPARGSPERLGLCWGPRSSSDRRRSV